MSKKNDAAWIAADKAYGKAGEKALKAMRAALPKGREVRWKVGVHDVYGEIVSAGSWSYRHASVVVKAYKSGKVYGLDAYRILWPLMGKE